MTALKQNGAHFYEYDVKGVKPLINFFKVFY
jgi:hypothetical protein